MVEVSGEDDNGKGIVRAPPSFQALKCTALRLVAQIRAIILHRRRHSHPGHFKQRDSVDVL